MADTLEFVPTCSVPGCNNNAVQTLGKTHKNYPRYRRSYWIHERFPETKDTEPFCCEKCHRANTARVNGVSNVEQLTRRRNALALKLGFSSIAEMKQEQRIEKCIEHGFTREQFLEASDSLRTALVSGYETFTEYNNARHPYLRYRKIYCENQDGRLGFKCTSVLPTQEQIDAAGLAWKPIQFLEVDHIDGNHTNNDPANLQTLCKCCHMIKSAQVGDHLTPGRKTRIV